MRVAVVGDYTRVIAAVDGVSICRPPALPTDVTVTVESMATGRVFA